MNKRTAIFVLVLVLLLTAYLYSCNKMVVFNHSGTTLESINIETEFMHKKLTTLDTNEVLRFTVFSPFDKSVKIKVQQPDRINSIRFSLQGFFLGENLNQVEITPDGEIRHGALGLER